MQDSQACAMQGSWALLIPETCSGAISGAEYTPEQVSSLNLSEDAGMRIPGSQPTEDILGAAAADV